MVKCSEGKAGRWRRAVRLAGRMIRLVERRSWRLRRAGGAVVGLAQVCYAVALPAMLIIRRLRRRSTAPVGKPLAARPDRP